MEDELESPLVKDFVGEDDEPFMTDILLTEDEQLSFDGQALTSSYLASMYNICINELTMSVSLESILGIDCDNCSTALPSTLAEYLMVSSSLYIIMFWGLNYLYFRRRVCSVAAWSASQHIAGHFYFHSSQNFNYLLIDLVQC